MFRRGLGAGCPDSGTGNLLRSREREPRVWARLRRISASIVAGQGASFPTFFVWHRPNLSEFVVCRLEEGAEGSRKALGLGRKTLGELIRDLPGWEGGPVVTTVRVRTS